MTNRRQGKPDEKLQDFTCEICVEPIPSDKKFKNGNKCIHPFCNECIAKYIEAKLQDNTAIKIKCPGVDCKHPLDPFACTTIITKQLFDKWCDVLCYSKVLESERRYCPYRDCSALILNECMDKKLKKTKCPSCKKEFCFKCEVPWHSGYWCSESRTVRDRNDVLVGILIENRGWTRCFNCGHSIERVWGCRAISCRCGATFCYKCGERFHLGSCNQKPSCAPCLFLLTLLHVLFFFYLVAVCL